MIEFYKKSILLLVPILLITLVSAYVGYNYSVKSSPLLPGMSSAYPWVLGTETDRVQGGDSQMHVNDSSYMLDYDFVLRRKFEYPYTTLYLYFAEFKKSNRYLDLSDYNTLSFNVKCSPHNVLSFIIHSYDPKISDSENPPLNRVASTFFSCDDEWKPIEIDLSQMEVPDWWLVKYNFELTDKGYDLGKVASFVFTNSGQSPFDTPSRVSLNELVLHGRDWRFTYIPAAVVLIVWLFYFYWLFTHHARALIADVEDRLQKDRPLMAYQQLSIEPRWDKDKQLVLKFMATAYADPLLSMEVMVAKLGVSRTKINDILKDELGFTFTAYLNKLRLTEAARLLSDTNEANIAEIAYSVGYNNVPYFNKLFKAEYGCTPKAFKKARR